MDAAQRMELFGNLVYVSTAIAVVGLGLAIFFFFFFDIRNVRALMTGKAKRQAIERMAEQNNKTGRLQASSGSVRDPSIPVVQHPAVVPTENMSLTGNLPPTVDMSNRYVEETVVLVSEETAVLSGSETSVLKAPENDMDQTRVLTQPVPQETPAPAVRVAPGIRFDITESTLVIHTKEIV